MAKFSKAERELVFKKYDGKCAYCGCDLEKGWHVDHIEPIKRLGDTVAFPERHVLENWNPACASCNINKHGMSVERFRVFIAKFPITMDKYSVPYKIAKRYGLVKETFEPVKFYFENFI